MGDVDRALARLATDGDFRARLLENAAEALAGYDVSEADRDRLLQEAQTFDAGIQPDPIQPTDGDGQTDAAGATG